MTTDPTPDWEQLLGRLDRIIEVLEEIRDARQAKDTPRGYTLGQQVQDLLKRHDEGQVSDAGFYDQVAEMTGISLPERTAEDKTMTDPRNLARGGIVVTFDPPHGPSQQEIADATIRAIRRQGRFRP